MDIRTEPPEPGTGAERAWLAGVLATGIPLAGAMAVEIAALDKAGITLAAPLAPNVNGVGHAAD